MAVQQCILILMGTVVHVSYERYPRSLDTKVFDHSDSEFVHIHELILTKYGKVDNAGLLQHRCHEYHSNTTVCNTSRCHQVYNLLRICSLEQFRYSVLDILCGQLQSKPRITVHRLEKNLFKIRGNGFCN